MKNITKYFAVATCAGALSLSSCIEETIQTNQVTEDQLKSSSKASEALIWAMPAFLNNLGTYSSDYAYDWGYGSIMHMRDVMTADQAVTSSGYNWYTQWSENNYMGKRYVSAYFMWAYYMKAIKTANSTIETLKGSQNNVMKGYLAAGYAYRALFYLDAARMYEFMPNEIFGKDYKTDEGNSINYLTMPILDENTTTEQAQNNPRVSHEKMFAFIENDLKQADTLMTQVQYKPSVKTLPSRACVLGLEARLYMWEASYLKETGSGDAQNMFQKAYDAAYAAYDLAGGDNAILDEATWQDTKTGFNSLSTNSWMWGASASTDDDVVQSGILNWTSWMSNEATFGYASAGPYVMISSELYNKMRDSDWRKLSFKAPEGSTLAGKEPIVVSDKSSDNYVYGDLPTYASLKFRPGEGNVSEYKVGAAAAYPLMRIEEMVFIMAEAAAHINPSTGLGILTTFMVDHRDANYSSLADDEDAIVKEIIAQKRIEFFGEGISFFDIKRLNLSVDRTLSNNFADTEYYKTNGRPAWMNFCISNNEENNNKGLKGFNNPDPSSTYTPVAAE